MASPDFGDALSFTYKHPVAHRQGIAPFVGETPQGYVDRDPTAYVQPAKLADRSPRRRAGIASPIKQGWRG